MNSIDTILSNLRVLATQICKQRNWRMGTLEELVGSPDVLGMNIGRGSRILIKLKDESGKYIEWFHLVGTLAHELAHNEIAGHGKEFDTLMNDIHHDMEKLDDYERIFAEMTGSYYSKGFTIVKGNTEGGGSFRNLINNSKTQKTSKTSINNNNATNLITETKEQRRRKILDALRRRGLV